MSENIIKIYDDNNDFKEYKILLTINKNYYYVVYTEIENTNIKKNLCAIKLKSLDSSESLPISEKEWQMIEREYNKLLEN